MCARAGRSATRTELHALGNGLALRIAHDCTSCTAVPVTNGWQTEQHQPNESRDHQRCPPQQAQIAPGVGRCAAACHHEGGRWSEARKYAAVISSCASQSIPNVGGSYPSNASPAHRSVHAATSTCVALGPGTGLASTRPAAVELRTPQPPACSPLAPSARGKGKTKLADAD
jgi:hypothetical protein